LARASARHKPSSDRAIQGKTARSGPETALSGPRSSVTSEARSVSEVPAILGRRMSKVCAICGKKPGFGHRRSHSMVATNRRFEPNLQRVRVLIGGKPTRAYVCTRCLKAGKVQKAL
jgi:large subunit ribosomal protein L28